MPAPRTAVLRGLDPTPFRFGDVEDAPAAPAPAAFIPLFEVEAPVLEAAAANPDERFEPLFEAPSPAPPEAPNEPPPSVVVRTYDDGLADGRQERALEVAGLEAEVERLTAAQAGAEDAERQHRAVVEGAVETLSALWSNAVRALEADLASLAIAAAEGVLEASLTDAQRTAASSGLAQAIDALSGGPAISISIHPVDYLHLRESGLADALSSAHAGLHWESDVTLDEGDWRASTSDGAVHRVRSEMLSALRERLGLTDDAS